MLSDLVEKLFMFIVFPFYHALEIDDITLQIFVDKETFISLS